MNSLYFNTTGNLNTASGFAALYSNTTGSNNSASGFNALALNTTGVDNTAHGSNALSSNTTGSENSALGYDALQRNTTGSSNTAGGEDALLLNTTGNVNTAFGSASLAGNSTGSSNTAIGVQSLVFNSTGRDNTGLGSGAAFHSETGNFNTAVGSQALFSTVSGSFNTAVGYSAGYQFNGNNNTALGAGTNCFGATNCTAIGYNAFADVSNKVRIGNSAVTIIEGQVPFTTPSDGRFKYQVKEDVKGLDFILQLRPVTYQFDVKRFDAYQRHSVGDPSAIPANTVIQAAYDEAAAIRRSGFIAQEVEKAANASGYNFSGIIKPKTEQDHYSLSYDAFVVPLVKAVQEQQQIIDAQNKKIADLQQQIDEIKKLIKK